MTLKVTTEVCAKCGKLVRLEVPVEINEADELGPDQHVVIHSECGGGTVVGTGQRTQGFGESPARERKRKSVWGH